MSNHQPFAIQTYSLGKFLRELKQLRFPIVQRDYVQANDEQYFN